MMTEESSQDFPDRNQRQRGSLHPLEERVRNFIREEGLLDPDHRLVLAAVSGGADSIALLRILSALRQVEDLNLYAVHVEHGIRGEESRQDQAFVERLCQALSVPLKVFRVDAPAYAKNQKKSLEEAARELRYQAFYQAEEELPGQGRIAVAHHRDDNAETVLLQMIRGTGWRGLCGLKPLSDRIIRPLLCVDRREIEAYLKDLNQSYRTDRTNLDTSIPRNRIRREVMPLLCSINEKASLHISQTAEVMRRMSRDREEEIRRMEEAIEYRKERKEDRKELFPSEISLADQAEVPPLFRKRLSALDQDSQKQEVLLLWYRTYIKGSGKDVGRSHILKTLELSEEKGNHSWLLPHGYCLQTEGSLIYLWKSRDRSIFLREKGRPFLSSGESLSLPALAAGEKKEFSLAGGRLEISLTEREKGPVESVFKKASAYTNYLDYDMIGDNLRIRGRMPGDRIAVSASGGHRKLKDFFMDQKIPREERDRIPLLCSGSDVLLVMGFRLASDVWIREDTKLVLRISWREADS
ncbi:MAG: tRNA lysidine(34) synthetase TilS [Lachnospiraceae bacterium]|nr:tRNA lysidine(34) synthetase TilS [Lachnospiraceae bacterium]